MHFMQSEEQLAFAEAVDDIAAGHGGTQISRDWAAGKTESGLTLWAQLAELGLSAITVPEEEGGMGGTLTDLTTVFERFGYNAVPGPYVESMALLPYLLEADDREALIGGQVASVAHSTLHPYALDADRAEVAFAITAEGSGHKLSRAALGEELESISPMRKLFMLNAAGEFQDLASEPLEKALNAASAANSAMLLGAGERLLHEAVEYAKVREQFGRAIGEYQALKHQLADVRVALSFARPLLWQASVAVDTGEANASRDVSAAKVKAAEAAMLAARASLQVHGAIGYTSEHDLSIWLNWVPALVGAWGTPAYHRGRIAAAILKA